METCFIYVIFCLFDINGYVFLVQFSVWKHHTYLCVSNGLVWTWAMAKRDIIYHFRCAFLSIYFTSSLYTFAFPIQPTTIALSTWFSLLCSVHKWYPLIMKEVAGIFKKPVCTLFINSVSQSRCTCCLSGMLILGLSWRSHIIVRRAGLMRSQQDPERWWSVPFTCAWLYMSFLLFCLISVYSSQFSILFWIMYLL